MTKEKLLIHVGCGRKTRFNTTQGFAQEGWREIRFDIDPSVSPDVVGSLTDLSHFQNHSVDAVFSSHNIEHLFPHEVPVALSEFHRVLKPEGLLVVTCPDLQSICSLVAEDRLTDQAYESPAGPITPIDMLFGHRPALKQGHYYMAHKCGFTRKVLSGSIANSGFQSIATLVRGYAPYFDIWALATKTQFDETEIRKIAKDHFPTT